jgi:hypothetical protein
MPWQLGTAARPDPDRQPATRLSKDDARIKAPRCCVLEGKFNREEVTMKIDGTTFWHDYD